MNEALKKYHHRPGMGWHETTFLPFYLTYVLTYYLPTFRARHHVSPYHLLNEAFRREVCTARELLLSAPDGSTLLFPFITAFTLGDRVMPKPGIEIVFYSIYTLYPLPSLWFHTASLFTLARSF